MNLNIFDVILLYFTLFICLLGIWVNYFEKFMPVAVHKTLLYGQMASKDSEAKYHNSMEIPKSNAKYFYIYAHVFSLWSLMYMIKVYFYNTDVNRGLRYILSTFMKDQQPVPVIPALVAMTLLTAHCARRLYETLFVTVVSKQSKMNIVHFTIAVIHYSICVMAILGASPLFCGTQDRKVLWSNMNSTVNVLPCVILFAWASYEQHQTNTILANLRKYKGVVVSEEYRMPFGRLFNYVSSPHRLTEIAIYVALAQIMRTQTYFLILVWVTSNQLQSSIGTHSWYKKTFLNCPQPRFALIPGVF